MLLPCSGVRRPEGGTATQYSHSHCLLQVLKYYDFQDHVSTLSVRLSEVGTMGLSHVVFTVKECAGSKGSENVTGPSCNLVVHFNQILSAR